jgi:hypothetical protein
MFRVEESVMDRSSQDLLFERKHPVPAGPGGADSGAVDIGAVDIGAVDTAGEVLTATTERPRVSLWKRTAGVVAVAAVMIIGNTATASAAPPSPVATLSTGHYTWHVARPAADAVVPAAEAPQHGEFPVVNADGSVDTRRWQSGTVVTVSDGSVTVLSSDGYRGVYRIGSEVDVHAVGVGSVVTVVGTVVVGTGMVGTGVVGTGVVGTGIVGTGVVGTGIVGTVGIAADR